MNSDRSVTPREVVRTGLDVDRHDHDDEGAVDQAAEPAGALGREPDEERAERRRQAEQVAQRAGDEQVRGAVDAGDHGVELQALARSRGPGAFDDARYLAVYEAAPPPSAAPSTPTAGAPSPRSPTASAPACTCRASAIGQLSRQSHPRSNPRSSLGASSPRRCRGRSCRCRTGSAPSSGTRSSSPTGSTPAACGTRDS